MMDIRRVYLKASYMGLTDYYATDFDGAYSDYAANMINKLRVKLALENDIELEDVEVETVWSASKKAHLGIIEEGQIYEP